MHVWVWVSFQGDESREAKTLCVCVCVRDSVWVSACVVRYDQQKDTVKA